MNNNFVVSMMFKTLVASGVYSTFKSLRNNMQGLSDEERKLEGQSNRYKAALTKLNSACRQNAGAHKGFEQAIGKVEKKLKSTREALRDYRREAAKTRKEANAQKRSEYQGEMMGVAGMAMAAATPVMAAVHFESSMADVRKTVNFKDESEFKQMGLDLQNMSERIPMATSGLADIAAAAGQAGIARSELLKFTEDAAKMGVAFDMSGTEAGGVMTGLRSIFKLNQDGAVSLGDAVNHLSNNMDATASSMLNVMNRAGSSGKLIGLTGQQVSALSATFLTLKTPPEVAGTAMNAMFNKLATADKQGKKFQTALQSIGMDAEGLKTAMKDDAQGAILTFLEAIDGAEDKMGILTDLFGAEYSDDMTKLVGGLDEYKKALGLVADEADYAGSMQKEYDVRSQTTANKLTLLKNKVTNAGIAFGTLLLPALGVAADMLGGVAGAVRYVAEEFPLLSKGVGMVAGLLIGFKVVSLAGGYAATFLSDGLTTARTVFTFLRPSVLSTNIALGWNRALMLKSAIASKFAALNLGRFAIVQKAAAISTGLFTGAINLLKVAWAASPFGFIATVVGLIGGAIYRLVTSWDKLVSAWKNSTGILSGVANVVSTFFGFGDDEEEDEGEQKTERQIHKKVGVVQEAIDDSPAMKSGSYSAPANVQSFEHQSRQQETTVHNTFHITQQPGQSVKELAREVAAILKHQNSGALHDGV